MCFISCLLLCFLFSNILNLLVTPQKSCTLAKHLACLFTYSELFLYCDRSAFLDCFFRLLLEFFILKQFINTFVSCLTHLLVVLLSQICLMLVPLLTKNWLSGRCLLLLSRLLNSLLWWIRLFLLFNIRYTHAEKFGKDSLLLLWNNNRLLLFFVNIYLFYCIILCFFLISLFVFTALCFSSSSDLSFDFWNLGLSFFDCLRPIKLFFLFLSLLLLNFSSFLFLFHNLFQLFLSFLSLFILFDRNYFRKASISQYMLLSLLNDLKFLLVLKSLLFGIAAHL